MATVKVVLRKKENKDGTFPLTIRITKDRKSSFIHLGQNIKLTDWDQVNQRIKKSHPNSVRLNNYLIKKLSEANDSLLEMETQKNDSSASGVKKKLKSSSGSSFFQQSDIYLNNLAKNGKYNQVASEKTRSKHFREFLQGQDIAFMDITVPLLSRFKTYLMITRPIKERTVVNHLMFIRSVFSQAIKEKIVDAKFYPFGKGRMPIKFPQSLKIGLSIEEVRKLEDLQLEPNSQLNHARNIWLFAFYFAGMRISDVLRLKWSDFQDDRLHYSMGKNAKVGSLKIPEKALGILQKYESREKQDLVFPELRGLDSLKDKYVVQRTIAIAVRKLNKNLKPVAKLAGIDKPLSMHIARHTFGNISGEKIPVQMLQKLYRHSSITTTIGYQANFIHKDADDALDAVVNF